MTAPTARRQPASSSPGSGQQAQPQAHRQAYHRRKTRAKAKSEALRHKEAAQVEALPVQHPHAAGIDIGSRSHGVCVGFTTAADSCLIQEFPAHTAGLKAIAAFLHEHQVNTVALESTGIHWIPLYERQSQQEYEAQMKEKQIKALRRKARQLGLEVIDKAPGNVATAGAASVEG